MSNQVKIPALWFDRDGCGPSGFALKPHHFPAEKGGAIPATLGLRVVANEGPMHIGASEMLGGGFMLYREQVAQLRDALDAWLSAEAPSEPPPAPLAPTGKLRVYVAASSAPDQMARAHAVSERLRKAGIELTSTWIANVTAVGNANPRDASREQRAQWSDECLTGVEQADVVLLLVPPPGSQTKGAWIELGYATARDKRVIASGDTRSTIFCGMEHVTEVATDEEAIGELMLHALLTGTSVVSTFSVSPDPCPACGHGHSPSLGGICVGCPCDRTPEADRAEIAAQLRADGGDPL